METIAKYQHLVESDWGDDPCILGVIYFIEHRGSYDRYSAPSDLDYFGYTEVEFCVLRPDLSVWPEAEAELAKNKRLRDYFEETILNELGEN
jgi:hypothetical protein